MRSPVRPRRNHFLAALSAWAWALGASPLLGCPSCAAQKSINTDIYYIAALMAVPILVGIVAGLIIARTVSRSH